MKKHFILIFAMVMMSNIVIWGQSIGKAKLLTGNGNETVAIEGEKLTAFANDYLKAIERADAERIFSYMNPIFVRKLGGRKNAIRFIKDDLNKIPQSAKSIPAELVDTNLIRIGEEPFNRIAIKIHSSNSNANERSTIDGFLIPIPYTKNNRQGVYFLHTEGILTSFTPSNCGLSYPSKIKAGGGNGSGSGNGNGSGAGSGVGSGSGTGNGSGVGTGAENGIGSGSGRGSGDGGGQSQSTSDSPAPPIPVDPEKTAGIQILSKPRPRYSFLAVLNNVQGSTMLRVTFLANGQIGTISPVKDLPCGLTLLAIEAARQIKFTPAMREGEPYSVVKAVQYNFTIYSSGPGKFEDLLN